MRMMMRRGIPLPQSLCHKFGAPFLQFIQFRRNLRNPRNLWKNRNPRIIHRQHDLKDQKRPLISQTLGRYFPFASSSRMSEQQTTPDAPSGGSPDAAAPTVSNGHVDRDVNRDVARDGEGGGEVDRDLVFQLSPSSFLKIQKGDITRWSVDGSSDAIVNPANERMLGGGGADGAIHRAAGPQLLAACYNVPEVEPGVRCPTGEARITPGFRLPASHVIHTVGPVYDDESDPEALLRSAYSNSLCVAKENNLQYVAFPAISCGVYGYPYDEAATVAISTVKEFGNDFKEVHFVLFSDDIYDTWMEKANELLRN